MQPDLTNSDEPYETAKQIAARLHVRPGTIYDWASGECEPASMQADNKQTFTFPMVRNPGLGGSWRNTAEQEVVIIAVLKSVAILGLGPFLKPIRQFRQFFRA